MRPCALVVDDEVEMLATYERLLHRQGLAVVTATTLGEGLARVGTEALALLVCDVHLPDGDGLDIVRKARGLPSPPPAIVVTGYASRESREEALAAGASSYLAKPFSVTTFAHAVQDLLQNDTDGTGTNRSQP